MTSQRHNLLALVQRILVEHNRSVGRQASSPPLAADPRSTVRLGSPRQTPAPSGLAAFPTAPGMASNNGRGVPSTETRVMAGTPLESTWFDLCPYCREAVVKPAYGHCGSDYCRDMHADARHEASRELEQDRA